MCGIAGQISADPNKIAANYPAYCRMQKSLARRGPDQRGIYLHGHAALIHARLAVVDLENGCQPMVLDQGGEKYILVYNGELYNTPELHAQLAALGHRFVSHSDTEVLLHAFAQWGPDCLEKLNGIFAFAVWQQRAQKLFLARDRVGVKPLFYALRGDSLIFASELKTLLCHPEIPPQVDAHGLADVLLLGPGRTPGCGVFRNVQELKPGCCAEYTVPQVGAPRLTVRRYWQLTDHEHPDDFTHTAAKVRDLVMDAVTRQLVSDVPVATFLSGGLDSSLISAIADSHFTARGKTLQTFSVGYQDNKKYFHATHFQPSPDAPYIRTMNQFLNAQHTWVTLDSEALAAALLEAGRDPGLGVRSLQARGITGQGVKIAIIDQSLLTDHPELSGRIAAYYDTGCEGETSSMHGPAVASLFAGESIGIAPDATLYYAAWPSWLMDSRYAAEALDWVVAQNEALPDGEKIRVVSVSAAPGNAEMFQNADLWDAAVARAEQAELLVLTVDGAGVEKTRLVPYPAVLARNDRDNPAACRTGFADSDERAETGSNTLSLPCSYRTVAEEYTAGQYSYTHDGHGGLSWGIPYCAGVMALGWQVDPTLTGEEMMQYLLSTAATGTDGSHIIDPVQFIQTLQTERGA